MVAASGLGSYAAQPVKYPNYFRDRGVSWNGLAETFDLTGFVSEALYVK
jgi:hypothetical protein